MFGGTDICPHESCHTEVSLVFVQKFELCPVCSHPVEIEATVTGPQLYIPQEKIAVTISGE